MTIVSKVWALFRPVCGAVRLAVALGLASGCAHAKDRWLSAKTEHFEVFTNANEREARVLVARLEQFREVFLRIMPGTPFREPRTTVVIFDRDRDFDAYKPLHNGKPREGIAGIFRGARDEVVVALSTERELERTIPTIYHEYVHLLMHARGFRLPPWLNEGLAELYETMELEDDKVTIGRHNPIHAMTLNRSTLIPLSRLFAVTHGSPEYNEGNRKNIFYAQSWALVHYCVAAQRKNSKPGDGFRDFLVLLSSGAAPEEAMQEVYGMSLTEMQEALERYVRGGRYQLKSVTIPKVDYAARVKFEPAKDFDREVALGNLKWRLQRNGDATYQMMQLAEREPQSARPYEVLAAIAESERDMPMMLQYWKKAAERQSTNAYIYGRLAEDTLRQYMIRIKPDYRLKPEISTELRDWLDRAVALEPDHAEAWDWLALTEAFSEKPRGAVVKQIQLAREKFGSRPRLLAGLAVIAQRTGMTDFAEYLADELLKMPEVVNRPENNAVKSAAIRMNDGRGDSWMQRREYYPELAGLARSLKTQVQKLKAATKPAAEAVAETPAAEVPAAK